MSGQAAIARVAVVVASTGRPAEVGQLLARLALQTRPADDIVLSVVGDADLPPTLPAEVMVARGSKGLTAQRNRGLERVLGQSDVVAFFDDDYVPSRRALERLASFFSDNPDVVGANGVLLADGINCGGVSFDDACALVDAHDASEAASPPSLHPLDGLYGCNMAFRSSAIGAQRFDEALPLYGWQEDIDFAASVAAGGGRLVKTDAFVGVHRGVRSARTSGKRLGYSQMVNPVYLCRKRTMKGSYAARLMAQNVLANLRGLVRPEPWIDRRGRLFGNLLGLADLVLLRVDPMKVLRL
jgi:GT2 family glycosyltransferase